MPTSDSGESYRRMMPERSPAAEGAPALACPRCESANTKFCYYNNYNLSQPRHFCKACRRYWTHGGTLRDVPVGGGSRKNAKRSRSAIAVNGATSSASASASSSSEPPRSKPEPDSDQARTADPNESSTYTSLLNSQAPGFLGLSGYGYGLGLGQGLEEMGFGYGYGLGLGQVGGGDFGASGGSGAACNTWQMNSGSDGGLVDSVDCFAWPDLSISMPGNGLK